MDKLGILLTLGAFTSGIMAMSFGGVTYPWNSGRIIGLFVCSGVLFTLLGLQQVYTVLTTTSQRIFPIQFFRMRMILILFSVTAAEGAAVFVPLYMMPLFSQFTRADSALESGVRLLPLIFLLVFAVISNGAILSAYGYYMPWFTLGGLLVLTGGALMYTVDQSTSAARVYGYSAILGFGTGMYAQAPFAVAQAIVDPELVSFAVGFITCAQISGIAIALAIANAVFLNRSQAATELLLPQIPRQEILQAISGLGSGLFQS
jgi:hypothetical protein